MMFKCFCTQADLDIATKTGDKPAQIRFAFFADRLAKENDMRVRVMFTVMIMITVMMISMMLITVMMMMILITTMSRACGNIGTTFEALKQHSTATTYHEQVKSCSYYDIEKKTSFFEET